MHRLLQVGVLAASFRPGELAVTRSKPPHAGLVVGDLQGESGGGRRLEATSDGRYAYVMAAGCLTRDDVMTRLSVLEPEIRRLGVRRLALFGSVLRNQAKPDSDVDLLVEFETDEKTLDRYMALGDLLEGALDHRVDLITTEALSPFIGPRILSEATDVLRAA